MCGNCVPGNVHCTILLAALPDMQTLCRRNCACATLQHSAEGSVYLAVCSCQLPENTPLHPLAVLLETGYRSYQRQKL